MANGVEVTVGDGVWVSVGVFVAELVAVTVAVSVGVGVPLAVGVIVGERTGVSVAVPVGGGVGVSVLVDVSVGVLVGKGVFVGVAVGGGGISDRTSAPGTTTMTPGVSPSGGVTTTMAERESGVGVNVAATARVGTGEGVGLRTNEDAAQPSSRPPKTDKPTHKDRRPVRLALKDTPPYDCCMGLSLAAMYDK